MKAKQHLRLVAFPVAEPVAQALEHFNLGVTALGEAIGGAMVKVIEDLFLPPNECAAQNNERLRINSVEICLDERELFLGAGPGT